jgi:hypothetical protein
MTSSGMHRSVEIVVTSMFRGERQDHVTILTGLGTGDCGLNFQTGETYLVFAVRGDDGSRHPPFPAFTITGSSWTARG